MTGANSFCRRYEAALTPHASFWARVDENVAAESLTDDETTSMGDDDDDDDEMRPLCVNIDGMTQSLFGEFFVKKSVFAKLNE